MVYVVIMININFDEKMSDRLLKILTCVFILIGIVFILLAKYIGNFSIRVVDLVGFIILLIDMKTSFNESKNIKKTTYILILIGLFIIFVNPSMLVLICGFVLLYYSGISMYNIVMKKRYEDIVKVVISSLGIFSGLLCVIFSGHILILVIRLIGAILLGIGCYLLYKYMNSKDKNNNFKGNLSSSDKYRFDNAEEIDEDR